MRIIFFGTPDFAVATLEALIQKGFNVVAVVTAPDRLGGRGMKETIASAVKKYAIDLELPILQPTNMKSPEFQNELKSFQADVQVVVAFRMMPEAVWNMPPLGTYNLHGSLLPKYRGAAPIQWAIINGEEQTGVTTFKLKHEIDTGNIAMQATVTIHPGEYLDSVYQRMMTRGASLMVSTMRALQEDRLVLRPQSNESVSKAPKIYQEECRIDVTGSCRSVFNHIRGLSPYPCAWMSIDNKKLKITKARYTYHHHNLTTFGCFVSDGKSYLAILTFDGLVFFDEVQLEGKRRMPIKDLLNGWDIMEYIKPPQLMLLPSDPYLDL